MSVDDEYMEIAPGVKVRVMYAKDIGNVPPDVGALMVKGHAEGAIPNGARVVKVSGDPRDSHHPGDQALVLSSIGPLDEESGAMAGEIGYFVAWDDAPALPVFVRGSKLRAL
jgi:hypothetical protein